MLESPKVQERAAFQNKMNFICQVEGEPQEGLPV